MFNRKIRVVLCIIAVVIFVINLNMNRNYQKDSNRIQKILNEINIREVAGNAIRNINEKTGNGEKPHEQTLDVLELGSTLRQNRNTRFEIPPEVFGFVDQVVEADDFTLPVCARKNSATQSDTVAKQGERTNFVFLKTHKCASDTLSAIFRRYAFNRDLNVVLPLAKKYILGWPHQLQPYMYRPSKKGPKFNILLDHTIYNHTFMSSIVPEDAIYIASLREPFQRLRSAMRFFGFAKRTFLPPTIDAVQAFLDDMEKLDSIYKSPDHVEYAHSACVPVGVSITRNAMAFDMGFPTGYHFGTFDESNNYEFIMHWLVKIQKEVKITILVEYFHESLVLLKRYMCWDRSDIFYKRSNSLNAKRRATLDAITYSEEQIEQFNHFSNVDTLLYKMSNATFWKRVSKLGQDFFDEVDSYENDLEEVVQFCDTAKAGGSINFPATKWDPEFTLTYEYCQRIFDKEDLRDDLKLAYDKLRVKVPTNLTHGHSIAWC